MVYDLKPDEPQKASRRAGSGAPASAADMVIEDDVHCTRCGYNLRGLPRRHRCPECGSEIRRSLSGHNLLNASPDWLKHVAWGLGMLLWSLVLNLAVIISWCFSQGAAHILEWASAMLALGGVWFLTTIEPRMQLSEKALNLRKILRVAAVGRFLCVAGVLLIWWSPQPTLSAVMSFAGGAALLTIVICLAFYLRDFARRMDDVELERSTESVIWGFAVSLGVFVLTTSAVGLLGVTRAGTPLACMSFIVGLAVLAFGIWFGILVYRYYSIIRWASYEARLT